ncbi:MAG: type I-U CRISPR-associated helicase/endonuclease Cas3 [Thermoanaerobaculia bacterium]|nr:type I-U CRISPR-associated helicase/endonuclease Cas3 [Thermoanaerobaculia bacterium]
MSTSFAARYRGTHDVDPFPWQTRLAEGGTLPELIDIPTGCGKTSVLDALLWRSIERGEARRIVWVVDRRLVVDDVFAHAEKVAASYSVRAVRWRGGITLDEQWLLEPHERALIVSTVDQVGSRILFRGYGVGWKNRAIHAGLLTHDTVVVLDEVHLSRHFARTLEQVTKLVLSSAGEGFGLPSPLQVIQMSATPGQAEYARVLRLEEDDLSNELLAKRTATRKWARLMKAEGTRFAKHVADSALRLAQNEGVAVVGVVLNRVDDARRVFEKLRSGHDAVLLTGLIRPVDRDRLLESPEIARARPNRDRTGVDRILFVVATQVVEVGVDLDFDALVTEAAPIDALRQRFGRLDRIGHHGATEAEIILRPDTQREDAIYGEELGRTWKWLWKTAKARKGHRVIDLGLAAEEDWPRELDTFTGEEPARPTAREVRILAETHPYLDTDVDIVSLLHGERDDHDRVSLVWRWELNETSEDSWGEVVDLFPPVRAEALAISWWRAKDWMSRHGVHALRWRSDEPGAVVSFEDFENREQIQHEDVLLVPSRYRANDAFGWNPDRTTEALRRQRWPLRASDEYPPRYYREDVGNEVYEGNDRLPRQRRVFKEPEGGQTRFEPYPPETALENGRPLTAGVVHCDPPDRTSQVVPETLAEHTARACAEGFRIVSPLDLPSDLEGDLVLALQCHDLGKLDPRFQIMLHDGDEIDAIRAIRERKPRAKSGVDWWNFAARRRAWLASGLPVSWRHEAESLHRADLSAANDSELVRHLIVTHHGRARPWLPSTDGEQDTGSAADILETTNRFWRLYRRFGPWTLAYLEALVVVADRRASEPHDSKEPEAPERLRLLIAGASSRQERRAKAPEDPVADTGLDGTTFLGFMAAIGMFRLLAEAVDAESADPKVWLSWVNGRARLHGVDRPGLLRTVGRRLAESEWEETRTLDTEGQRLRWDLCGAGRVQLRSTLPGLREELIADEGRLERTIFAPWTWSDKGSSLGWIPSMRDHALRARAPTKDQPFRENGALWLAWEGIPVFGRETSRRRSAGWRRYGSDPWRLIWPLWSEPATLETIRSLLRSIPDQEGDLGVEKWWMVSRLPGSGRSSEISEPRPLPVPEWRDLRTSAGR